MKKKFKNILLFSSILGLGAITAASSIALTSCSNVSSNVDKPVDNTTPSKPGDSNNNNNNGSTQKPSTPVTPNPNPNNPSVTPPNTNIPDNDSNVSGGNNQDSSNNQGGSQEQTPIVLPTLDERQRAIIEKSPTLSWLYDTNGGARFILNNQNITDKNSLNTDVKDSNVKDLMTLCGLKENIDPFKDNAYFPDALIFSQAVNKVGNPINVNITVDPTLASSISFYLFDKYAVDPLHDANWIKLGDSNSTNIELIDKANLYLAIKFNDDITQYGYDVPQLVPENFNNSISSQYTFENLPKAGQDVNDSQVNTREQTSDISQSDFNKKIFFYKLNRTSTEQLVDDSVGQTSNKVELVMKKKDEQQNKVQEGWKKLPSLEEGQITPKESSTNDIPTIGVNDAIGAYTYTVLDKDTIAYPNYSALGEKTTENWFKIDNKKSEFWTTYSDLSNTPGKRNVNLYILYTNGNNIDLNQLVVKAGCKLLLINNNPNKTSKVICSNNSLQYGKGNTNGLQFDLGSSFGWFGRFDFTSLVKSTSLIGSNIKDFIFDNKDKLNYTLPTVSKSLVSLEPNKKQN